MNIHYISGKAYRREQSANKHVYLYSYSPFTSYVWIIGFREVVVFYGRAWSHSYTRFTTGTTNEGRKERRVSSHKNI